MNVEERLKDYILTNYKSIREFSLVSGIAYSTIVNVLERGIMSANIGTVIKICQTLNISVDELSQGRITQLTEDNYPSVEQIIRTAKEQMLSATDLTLNGSTVESTELVCLLTLLDNVPETVIKNRHLLKYYDLLK